MVQIEPASCLRMQRLESRDRRRLLVALDQQQSLSQNQTGKKSNSTLQIKLYAVIKEISHRRSAAHLAGPEPYYVK